jgi:uncharacterized protein (DUF169 family)
MDSWQRCYLDGTAEYKEERIMNAAEVSTKLVSSLELDEAPVALMFAESPPEGVRVLDTAVPSACSLWRLAAADVFYAPAQLHFNCPVGAMTMGFRLPESVSVELSQTVSLMTGNGYLNEGEATKLPIVHRQSQGIVYGPLSDFPADPDLVLLWVSPRQAMLVSEAAGTIQWTSEQPTEVYGRPACSALPIALGGARPVVSLGCQGMRTFTAISEDRLLVVLPGGGFEQFVAALSTTVAVNSCMHDVYEERRAPFAT